MQGKQKVIDAFNALLANELDRYRSIFYPFTYVR